VPPPVRQELEQLYRSLNPLQLRREIDTALAALWRLAAREVVPSVAFTQNVAR